MTEQTAYDKCCLFMTSIDPPEHYIPTNYVNTPVIWVNVIKKAIWVVNWKPNTIPHYSGRYIFDCWAGTSYLRWNALWNPICDIIGPTVEA